MIVIAFPKIQERFVILFYPIGNRLHSFGIPWTAILIVISTPPPLASQNNSIVFPFIIIVIVLRINAMLYYCYERDGPDVFVKFVHPICRRVIETIDFFILVDLACKSVAGRPNPELQLSVL